MNDRFNDKVKDAFDQLEDDFDPALIWSGINAKMPPVKKKKRRFLFWWIGGAVMALVLLSTFLYSDNLSSNTNSVSNSISDSEEIIKHKDINQESDQSNQIVASLVLPEENHSIKSSSKEIVGNDTNFTAEKSSETSSALNETAKEVVSNQTFGYPPENRIKEENIFAHAIENRNEDLGPITKDSQARSDYELEREDETTKWQFEILKIETLKSNLITSSLDLELPILSINPNIDIYKKSDKMGLFGTLEIYGGMSKGSKTNQSSNVEYVNIRNESEILLEQLNLGARINLLKFNGVSIFTGAKYSRITDRWISNLEYSEDYPFTYTDYSTEFPDGRIENHDTTITLLHDVKRYVEQYNSEQIISVPLEVRYGTQINNWSFSLGVAIELNYLFGAHHKIMDLNGLPVKDEKTNQWLDPSLSMGMYTSYAIDPQWNITAGLNYRRLSTNNSSVFPDLNSRYTLLGLEFGVARNIN